MATESSTHVHAFISTQKHQDNFHEPRNLALSVPTNTWHTWHNKSDGTLVEDYAHSAARNVPRSSLRTDGAHVIIANPADQQLRIAAQHFRTVVLQRRTCILFGKEMYARFQPSGSHPQIWRPVWPLDIINV